MALTGAERRDRLARARLYLVCDARPGGGAPGPFLRAALAGGVDMVQLRDKEAGDEELRAAGAVFRRCCADARALFLVNDRPDLAVELEADGVHVGQDDAPVDIARAAVGAERLVGLSTHDPVQVAAGAASGADYVAVGPVHATPTKPGRPAVGLQLISHAAEAGLGIPWFAIGGLHAGNVEAVIAAGATRAVVVRAIGEADDPAAAARSLRRALEGATVGAA